MIWFQVFLSNANNLVHVVDLYSSIDTTVAWKKSLFILSDRSDFHMIDSLTITAHALKFTYLSSSISSTESYIDMFMFQVFQAIIWFQVTNINIPLKTIRVSSNFS